MRRLVNRRRLAVLGLLLATSQLLTACVVVPGPYHYRPRPAVVVQPGYYPYPHHHHPHGYWRR